MTGLSTEIVRRDEIRLVEDTDGYGYADKATVFARGFNRRFPRSVDRSELVAFFAEDRFGEAPQVTAEDLFPLSGRQVGIEDLGQLRGIGTGWSVPAPDETVGADLGNREIDLP